jgi:hypothetical protein
VVSKLQAHKDRVAQLPCILCTKLGHTSDRSELHHIRDGQGMSQRASDWLVVPLCPDCHRGDANGWHGRKGMWRLCKWTELDALAATIEALA